MALPASWTEVQIFGTYTNRDGTAATGWITFESRQIVTVDGVTVVPKKITAELDGTGYFSALIPSTDDPDLSVTGWAYLVTEHVADARPPYLIEVPYASGAINLATVTPAVPSPSVPVLTGIYASDVG